MATRLETLTDELANDPETLGYSLQNDSARLTTITAVNRNNWVELSGAQIFEAISRSSFGTLTVAEVQRVDRVLSLSVNGGGIATDTASQARAELVSIFGAPSSTITNLASIANQQVSRATELGLEGWVTLGWVAAARTP